MATTTNRLNGQARTEREFLSDETKLAGLLAEWVRYARTMHEAGLIALPGELVGRTVAALDATA